MKETHILVRDFRTADWRGERIYTAGTRLNPSAAPWFQYGVEQGAIVPISAAPPDAESQGAELGAVPRRRDGESDLQFAERMAALMRHGGGVATGDLGDQVVALLRQRAAGAELVRA